MADAQEKRYSVTRAFNSFKGDGSGEERYFTTGNQHELADFVSPEELQYRIDEGYVMEEVVTPEPVRQFVHPADAEAAAPAFEDTTPRRAKSRRGKAAADHTEE